MKSLKKVFNLILIGALLITGLYFAGEKGLLAHTPLKNFDHKQLNIFSKQSKEQAQLLTNRAKQTSQHVQQVLGENVEVSQPKSSPDLKKDLPQKTLEYARYLYCQQVVEDWQKTHPAEDSLKGMPSKKDH
jgi:hypothetical protein